MRGRPPGSGLRPAYQLPSAKSASHHSRSIVLHESCCVKTRRRKAMKFAPARTQEQFRTRNRSPAAIFHEISSHTKIARTVVHGVLETCLVWPTAPGISKFQRFPELVWTLDIKGPRFNIKRGQPMELGEAK